MADILDELGLANLDFEPNQDSLFAGFDDDEEEVSIEGNEKQRYDKGTLIKLFNTEGVLKNDGITVAFIDTGLISRLEDLKQFLIDAQLSQYTSEEVAGAYTEGLIEDVKRDLLTGYKIIRNVEPTSEEIKSAKLFDDHFKKYAVSEG